MPILAVRKIYSRRLQCLFLTTSDENKQGNRPPRLDGRGVSCLQKPNIQGASIGSKIRLQKPRHNPRPLLIVELLPAVFGSWEDDELHGQLQGFVGLGEVT
jgi:hypothetical protein